MLPLFLPFPFLQVEERVSETKADGLFPALLLIFSMTFSALFLDIAPQK